MSVICLQQRFNPNADTTMSGRYLMTSRVSLDVISFQVHLAHSGLHSPSVCSAPQHIDT